MLIAEIGPSVLKFPISYFFFAEIGYNHYWYEKYVIFTFLNEECKWFVIRIVLAMERYCAM